MELTTTNNNTTNNITNNNTNNGTINNTTNINVFQFGLETVLENLPKYEAVDLLRMTGFKSLIKSTTFEFLTSLQFSLKAIPRIKIDAFFLFCKNFLTSLANL